jgi:hypothetical protein
MLTADIQLNEFNRGINRLITRCRVEPARVLKTEVGELTKTLVRLSPPRNLGLAKSKAEKDVRKVIRPLPTNHFRTPKLGKKDKRWLYATPHALVGVATEDYLTISAVKPAKRKLYQAPDRAATQRLGRRGEQVVTKTNRLVVSRAVYQGLLRNLKANFGRLKAGWLIGVFRGQIQLTGGNKPPQWVLKHRHGARGDSIDQLKIPSQPSFTIINRAKGVSSDLVRNVVRSAIAIRAKAMKAKAALILSGKRVY